MDDFGSDCGIFQSPSLGPWYEYRHDAGICGGTSYQGKILAAPIFPASNTFLG